VLLDAGQRQAVRRRELADRGGAVGEPLEDAAAGRIGQREERPVEVVA
jgi:hypothetical protein